MKFYAAKVQLIFHIYKHLQNFLMNLADFFKVFGGKILRYLAESFHTVSRKSWKYAKTNPITNRKRRLTSVLP